MPDDPLKWWERRDQRLKAEAEARAEPDPDALGVFRMRHLEKAEALVKPYSGDFGDLGALHQLCLDIGQALAEAEAHALKTKGDKSKGDDNG